MRVPGDRAQLAWPLGTDHAAVRVLGADPAGDLHDQRDREPEPRRAPGGAHSEPLPERPGGGHADLPGATQRRAQMEAAVPVLAQGAGRVRDSIRRAVPGAGIVNQQGPRAGNATAGRRGYGRPSRATSCLAIGVGSRREKSGRQISIVSCPPKLDPYLGVKLS